MFDTAFHPSVIEECSREPILDKMMVALLIEYAEKFADLIVLNKEACKKVKKKSDIFLSCSSCIENNEDSLWTT